MVRFSVGYDAIAVDDILDIHKYLMKKYGIKQCLDLLKKCFFTAMSFSHCNARKYFSMNNQECKVIPAIMNINSNEPSFYPYSIFVNKCGGRCNNIDDPCAKLCVPDVIKSISIKVFNLILTINETFILA